jgi:hypothetical protein
VSASGIERVNKLWHYEKLLCVSGACVSIKRGERESERVRERERERERKYRHR